jgi:arylsulfatase I/J
MVGKWDCGMATPQHTPHGRGFETSLTYFHHANDYFTREEGACHGNTTSSSSSSSNTNTRTSSSEHKVVNNVVKMVDLWRDTGPAHATNESARSTYEETIFMNEALRIIHTVNLAGDGTEDGTETTTTSPTTAPKPLFLYYAAHVAHEPYEVPTEYESQFDFIDVEERRVYHAMVKLIDDTIATLVSAIQKHENMWENTLFVLTSDNGGPIGKAAGANNYP